jgi:hypothetical protein
MRRLQDMVGKLSCACSGISMSLTAAGQLDVYYRRGIFTRVEEDVVWFDVFAEMCSACDTRGGLVSRSLGTCMSYSLCVQGAQSLQRAASDRLDIGSREVPFAGQAERIVVQMFQDQKWWIRSMVEKLSYLRAIRDLLQRISIPV